MPYPHTGDEVLGLRGCPSLDRPFPCLFYRSLKYPYFMPLSVSYTLEFLAKQGSIVQCRLHFLTGEGIIERTLGVLHFKLSTTLQG